MEVENQVVFNSFIIFDVAVFAFKDLKVKL